MEHLDAGPGHVLTWRDGVSVVSDDRAWSVTSAEFLGCGFRVQIPAARDRQAAYAFAHRQVHQLAELLGASVDETPWRAVAGRDVFGRLPLVVEGGWDPVFRGPPGAATTRVLPAAGRPADRQAPLVVLPWTVSEGSALDALPLHSTHEAASARQLLGGDQEGLWLRRDGSAARSTAGHLLVWLDGTWWQMPDRPGRVPTWVASETADGLRADARAMTAADLAEVAASGGLVTAIDPLGALTCLDHSAELAGGPQRAWERLVGVRDAVLAAS